MIASSGRTARRGGAGFALLAMAFGLPSPGYVSPEPAEAVEAPPKVLVRATGDRAESRETIPITRRSAAKRKVVTSMDPTTTPALQQQDRVEVTAEVQVTTDCDEWSRRCAGAPYSYNPIVSGRLVLADRARQADGPRVEPISDRQRIRCRQRNPGRTHHCVIVFTDVGFSHSKARDHGCAPSSCRMNLVLDAHNRRARGSGKDKLIIGSNRPNGEIEQDKSRINAVRFRPGSQPRVSPTVTGTRQANRLRLKSTRKVVYSQRLNNLRAGAQLAVDARMRTKIGHLPYSVRVNSQLILAQRRKRAKPGDVVKRVASRGGEISESNGFNCVHQEAPCLTEKIGTLKMKRDAGRPLYVNLVVGNSAKLATPKGGDTAKVAPHGRLKVVRYPAALRG